MFELVYSLVSVMYWVYAIGSWCMCFYVFFSSSEGIHWFTTLQNYLLLFGAFSGLALLPITSVPIASIALVFTGWSFYAMLVTAYYRQFGLWWRHIIPVNVPLTCLFLFTVYRSMCTATKLEIAEKRETIK